MSEIKIFTDGGARGNPGPAAVGVVIFVEDKEEFAFGKTIGESTNNIAEYTAVIEALKCISENKIVGDLSFFLDSELVVKQLNGEYKVKDEKLKKLYYAIRETVISYPGVIKFDHIPRSQNKKADSLVNKALDGQPQ